MRDQAELNGMKRLLEKIDCVKEYPKEKFFSNGTTQIIEFIHGHYREAESKPSARFGYQFIVEKVGNPHEIVIRYPDDKRRFMCILDGTCYDLNTSVMTGFTQPLSNQMLEMRIVFWPRWKECSITFLTYSTGEPAAVATIEIYEMDSLPSLSILKTNSQDDFREVGVQYEDPCGTAASEGAITHAQWTENVLSYMKYSGQKSLYYPLAWYHGPLFPSKTEPADGMDLVVGLDKKRTQYTRWMRNPADWYSDLLKRFGEEGLEFHGVLTLLRLGSLMKRMNINLRQIRKGKETINNMLWNNRVQAGTHDWTPIHNAINYDKIAQHLKPGKVVRGFHMPWNAPKLAYGEQTWGPYHAGSIFNPLHPIVQEAILAFVKEIAERYGKFPAFKGITINMYTSAIIWWGSIHSGYDDYTINLFEQETGIKIPVKPKAKDRFSKRYEYCCFTIRTAWIEWRCLKIRELIRKIRDQLQAIRPDLLLTITLWDETFLFPIFGKIEAAHQIFARKSNFDLFKEAGIDLKLYENEPGIHMDLTYGCTRDRGGHGKVPTSGVNSSPEDSSMYRDFNFLDPNFPQQMQHQATPGVYIFNCWVESWGKHVWQQCDPNDPNLPSLSLMDGLKADGILEINSLYPDDGFWWNSQLRIIPGMQAGVHFMEPYAWAVAEFDACRITRGGLFLDKSHSEQIQQFVKAYCSLPRVRFTPIAHKQMDPVAVRFLKRQDRLYFYLVNRDYYPISVNLKFNGTNNKAQNLANSESNTIDTNGNFQCKLNGYEIQSFSTTPNLELIDFTIQIPEDIKTDLSNKTVILLDELKLIKTKGFYIPGQDLLAQQIEIALKEERYGWLRRALTSYISRKTEQLCKK